MDYHENIEYINIIIDTYMFKINESKNCIQCYLCCLQIEIYCFSLSELSLFMFIKKI